MSGKGDKDRTKDHKRFGDNYDLAFGKNKSKRDREKKITPLPLIAAHSTR